MSTLKRVFAPYRLPSHAAAALLLVRLVVGVAFMLYGWGKIQAPFGWNPPQSPLQIPPILQFLAAVAEFGGGAALVLGLFTRLAALGIACTMAVAVFFHRVVLGDPFVNTTGGSSYDSPLVFLSVALLLLSLGPGRIALDRLLFGERD